MEGGSCLDEALGTMLRHLSFARHVQHSFDRSLESAGEGEQE